jgi:hypothetical protein
MCMFRRCPPHRLYRNGGSTNWRHNGMGAYIIALLHVEYPQYFFGIIMLQKVIPWINELNHKLIQAPSPILFRTLPQACLCLASFLENYRWIFLLPVFLYLIIGCGLCMDVPPSCSYSSGKTRVTCRHRHELPKLPIGRVSIQVIDNSFAHSYPLKPDRSYKLHLPMFDNLRQ